LTETSQKRFMVINHALTSIKRQCCFNSSLKKHITYHTAGANSFDYHKK